MFSHSHDYVLRIINKVIVYVYTNQFKCQPTHLDSDNEKATNHLIQ